MGNEDVQRQLTQLRAALKLAKTQLQRQAEVIRKKASPLAHATVVAVTSAPDLTFGDFRSGHKFEVLTGKRTGQIASVVERVRWDHEVRLKFEDGTSELVSIPKKTRRFARAGSPKDSVTIAYDGRFFEVERPSECEVKPGNTVLVDPSSMRIVSLAPIQFSGEIVYVRRVIDEMFSEVDYQSSPKVILNGTFGGSLEKGDRIALDGTATVIVRNFGKTSNRFQFTAKTNVSWSDIGGLEAAKEQMIEAVELPHANPDLFTHYGKRPIKGVLLYGPPGCGKTMLGKATATALARIYNGSSAPSGFLYVKGPEILDRYVGVAEAAVRELFQNARRHKKEHGYPAVVFIDEADAILAKRGSGISSDIERTIVPMFLTEMDGLEDSGALVIIATNRADILDPAVVRDGRIDRKIMVGRPTRQSAKTIFSLNLKGVPLNNGYSRAALAKLGSDQVFSSKRTLYRVQVKSGELNFTLSNILNGGMIAGIVDQATSIAMHRDLNSRKKSSPGGLKREDLIAAINAVEKQNRDLDHTDELAEFVHDFRDDVVGIKRLRQGKA